MSPTEHVAALRNVVSQIAHYRLSIQGTLDTIHAGIAATTSPRQVSFRKPPGLDIKPARTAEQEAFMDEYPLMFISLAPLYSTMSALEQRITLLCDTSGWVDQLQGAAGDWENVERALSAASQEVFDSQLPAARTWKGSAGLGYQTTVAAHRRSLSRVEDAARGMRFGCSRAAGAGESFYGVVRAGMRVPLSVYDANHASVTLPQLANFTQYQHSAYQAADAAITAALATLEANVARSFGHSRSKREGGTGDPDDLVSVTETLPSWAAK
ncbi:MAG TPA: hypothetical protein PLX71_03590 [Phycicoccus sp.]|nr:hypothetical protein [Phycicoccus sp.]